jgi:hypothetical protein
MSLSLQSRVATLRVKLKEQQRASLLEKYSNEPALWIEERAGGFMWSIPRKIAQSIVTHRRTAVPACHGVGKSWLFGRLAVWWIDSHPPGTAFVVTTAPSNRQVVAVLWKEIRRAWSAAGLSGRLNQKEWWLNNELVALGYKPADYDPTAFQGIHAKYCLVLLDEGCGIPENIYIAANSLASNQFSRLAVIGNPDDPETHFKKICEPNSGWNVIPISAFDTPNFTGEYVPETVKENIVDQVYVEEMRRDVGEDSPIYLSKILGQFPENSVDGVVLLSWVRRCQEMNKTLEATGDDETDLRDLYDYDDLHPVELGVDVGAGDDETSVRARHGILADGRVWEGKTREPEEAFEIVVQALQDTGATRCKIDVIGIGWGLLGMLRSTALRGRHHNEIVDCEIDISHCEFVGVNVGMGATDPTRFPRLRDQLWWEVGRELSITRGWDLTYVDELTISQLISPTWKADLANRIKVESKRETMKRTSKPSPNRADALLLAYCNPPTEDIEEVVIIHEPEIIGVDL